jgi:hypothetical protein
VNGVTSLIRFVRITSRGYIIEEIDNYGMLDSIFKEVTTPMDETKSVGWIGGYASRHQAAKAVAATSAYPTGVASTTSATDGSYTFAHSHADMSRVTNNKKLWAGKTTKCFRLDMAGFFKSNHYIPLEWSEYLFDVCCV